MPRRYSQLTTTVFVLFISLFESGTGFAAKQGRPFWTEKSSYIEGNFLYAVGVASNVSKEEEGRKVAFTNGKQEIANFMQISDLPVVDIETQMTYTEDAGEGKFRVFRLLKVEYDKLENLKQAQLERTKAKILQAQGVQEREIAIKREGLKKLEENSKTLQDLDEQHAATLARIRNQSSLAIDAIRSGMTEADIARFVGKPSSRAQWLNYEYLNYGNIWVALQDGIASCLIPAERYQYAANCNSHGMAFKK